MLNYQCDNVLRRIRYHDSRNIYTGTSRSEQLIPHFQSRTISPFGLFKVHILPFSIWNRNFLPIMLHSSSGKSNPTDEHVSCFVWNAHVFPFFPLRNIFVCPKVADTPNLQWKMMINRVKLKDFGVQQKWLVVWNIFFFFHILGMSSSQLRNSYFSEG